LGGTLLALSGPGALPVLAVVETLLVVLLVVTAERRSAGTGEDAPAAGVADEPAAAPSRAH
ncbi:hypothetical protein GTW37_29500, partial [Streptomyces sp. SID4931]